jgi:hypothetical protein
MQGVFPCLMDAILTSAFEMQIKYFKEKRVMEYNRDETIKKIQKYDA